MFGRLTTALLALFLVAQPLAAAPAPASPPGAGNQAATEATSVTRPGAIPTGAGWAQPSATRSNEYWFTVAGSGFIPESSSLTWNYPTSIADGCMNPTSAGTWRASINVPDGSILKEVYFGYYNTALAQSSTAYIQEFALGGTTSVPAKLTSVPGSTLTGFANTWQEIAPAVTVDNFHNALAFKWNVTQSGGGEQELCFVTVGYQPPSVFGSFLPSLDH